MGRRRRGRRSEKKALGISGCEPTCSGEKRIINNPGKV
jgi:hypothetical protein